MQFTKHALITLALPLMFMACDKNKSSSTTSSASTTKTETASSSVTVDEANNVYAYHFIGLNSEGQTCDTGTRSFRTKHEFCLDIQDPRENGSCATDERVKNFNRFCRRPGFSYPDAISCKVAILDKNARVDIFGYDEAYLLKSNQFCAGRNKLGNDVDGIKLEHSRLFRNIFLNINLKYVPETSGWRNDNNSRSYAQLQLTQRWDGGRYEGDGRQAEWMEFDLSSSHLYGSRFGETSDRNYKYHVSCLRVPSCDGLNR